MQDKYRLPEYVVIDVRLQIAEMQAQSMLSERGYGDCEDIIDEMLRQCFDVYSDAKPGNNCFKNKSYIPVLLTSMLRGVDPTDAPMVDDLNLAFTHLYVGIRDQLNFILQADKLVDDLGTFDYVMSRRIGKHTLVLRHVPDTPKIY